MSFPLRSAALCCALALPSVAVATQVKVVSVTASSSYPADHGVSYEPANLKDGKAGTAWIEGEEGPGLGAWVELALSGPVAVREVRIWAGLWYTRELWERTNRPKKLEIRLSDGTLRTCELRDDRVVQSCDLGGLSTSTIRLRLAEVHQGTAWLDTAISEIQVFDDRPDPRLPVVSYAQSSSLPGDADSNYDLSNTTDGLLDTMWCEGNKSGDGTGEWIEYHFGGPRRVSGLELVNGVGGSVTYWMAGNRATRASIEFDDGPPVEIEIKNSGRSQVISFPPRETRKIRLAFVEVYRGKEYNDLCISEAYLLE